MKILVADDSRAMRRLVVSALERAGITGEILEAGDGGEALRLSRAYRPDLVLADWNMPVLNGYELFEAIQKEKLPCKVGFVTSEVSQAARKAVVEKGAQFVIGKPFISDDFREAIVPLLGRGGAAVPSVHAVAEVLSRLFGQPTLPKPGPPVIFGGQRPVVVGIYDLGGPAIQALVALDAEASIILAHLLDPTGAHYDARAGGLPSWVLENVREVLNVLSRVFRVSGAGALALKTLRVHPPALPTDVSSILVGATRRLDLSLESADKKRGALSFYAP